MSATNSAFVGNAATGGFGGLGYEYYGFTGDAYGGALFNQGGTLSLSNCYVAGNIVSSTSVATVEGGGIYNATGSVAIVQSVLSSNSALGGALVYAAGGGVYHNGGVLTISRTILSSNQANSGSGGFGNAINGAQGQGGGLFNGDTAVVADCTFASNLAAGGSGATYANGFGANGGPGQGGGVCNSGSLILSRCTVAGNDALGGPGSINGGDGGIGYGGGVFNNGISLSLINCTLANNLTVGGMGGAATQPSGCGPGGNSFGGGIYNSGSSVALTNCTLSGNAAVGGLANTECDGGAGTTNGIGYAGNIFQAGTLALIETIVTAGVSNNAQGTLTDLGYNISSDASCAFTGPGSLNITDPKIQPLANNGGATQTMALWPGSPAIDAGITLPGITTDQRGIARPYGSAPDIGAYEWNGAPLYYNNFSLATLQHTNGGWSLSGVGPTNQTFRILVSSNLLNWTSLATNSSGAFGEYSVTDTTAAGTANRFYRLVSP